MELNNFRIVLYMKGWLVEVQKKTWYGRKYWTNYIHASGLPDTPWFHSEYKYAEMNLLNKIKNQTKKNSQ